MRKPVALHFALALSMLHSPIVCASTHDGANARPRVIVLDAHLDTPRHFARPGWHLSDRHDLRTDFSQVDYPRMADGGLDGGFWAIFTMQGPLSMDGYAQARDFALRRATEIREAVQSDGKLFALATRADDAPRIVASGRRIVYMSIENAYPLGMDASLLSRFRELGVRMLGLVHSKDNQFADSATDDHATWGGLSPAGVALVAEANRLGVLLDASHASDAVLDQVLRLSKAPIVLSHSGCKAVYDHPRNVDDARLKALAAAGGVIHINSLGAYLAPLRDTAQRDAAIAKLREHFGTVDEMSTQQAAAYLAARAPIDREFPPSRASFDDFMKHVLHAISVAGADHVGIGADWDGGGGVEGMADVSGLARVAPALRAAGLSEADIAKILGGNTLRALRAAAAMSDAR